MMIFSNRAQLFIFDGILAIVIIIVSFGMVLSYSSSNTENNNIYSINQQLLNAFTKTKINDLNDVEIRSLFKDGYIQNIENTVAQQVGEFTFSGQNGLAENLTKTFVEDFITKQMNVNISLGNDSFSTELFFIRNRNVDFEDAKISSVTKRSIIGFINSSVYYGPYVLRIEIWQ